MLKAGVIGLGQIGGGVAICLARADRLSGVYDVRPDAADSLEGVPACVESPAELARASDVIVIAVVNADQVRSVLDGPEGVLAGAAPGKAVILLSTVSLTDLEDIRQRLASVDMDLVDCGVTGGPASAEKGLVSLVGADEGTLARVKPVIEDFSKSVVHMGGPGAGMAGKIARNVIVYTVWRAGYEGAALARAAGVDVAQLAEAIDASAENVGGPSMWMKRPDPTVDKDEHKIREHVLTLLEKDLGAALGLAEQLGVDLPMAEFSRQSAKQILKLED